MKKITLLLTLATSAILGITSGYSQGTINFGNNASTLVTLLDNFNHFGPAPLTTTSGIKLQLFYLPDPAGSTAPTPINPYSVGPANWVPITTLASISPLAGRFSAGGVTTGNDVAPGGNVWLQLVAWDRNDPSLSVALSGSGNSIYFGFSPVWSQGTGDGGAMPAVPIVPTTGVPNAGNFPGMEMYNAFAPEPSTMVIGALGTVVLLLFRRSIKVKTTLNN